MLVDYFILDIFNCFFLICSICYISLHFIIGIEITLEKKLFTGNYFLKF